MRRPHRFTYSMSDLELAELDAEADKRSVSRAALLRMAIATLSGRDVSIRFNDMPTQQPSPNGARPAAQCIQVLPDGERCTNSVALDRAGNPYHRCLSCHLEREERRKEEATKQKKSRY